jgi:large subunit ribosomal protein L22
MANETNKAVASLPLIKGSVQKVNLVAALIRRQPIMNALNLLQFCNKGVAPEIKKLLESAIANAENNHNLDIDNLVVDEVLVGKSLTLKRVHARARGRAGKILKRYSNIKITLVEKA